MLEIKIGNFDYLHDHSQEWNSLVYAMRKPSVFLSSEWILTWWEYFGNAYEPFIVTVNEGSKTLSYFPLAKRSMVPEDFLLGGRILTLCGNLETFTDHVNIISRTVNVGRSYERVIEYLLKDYKDWDVLFLSHMSDTDSLLEALNKFHLHYEVKKITTAPYIPLTGSFDDYMSRFNGKHRHNIKRLWNRLKQQYGVTFSMYSIEGENQFSLDWYLDELFRLHELRKESTNTQSTFKGNRIKSFHYNVARKFSDKGWLRLGALLQDGKAIAVGYGFSFEKQFNYYQSGLDPSWEKHSVGSTLLLELIKKACEEGCVEFDFLRGDESYKSTWTDQTRDLSNVYVFNTSKSGKLLRSIFHAREKVKKVFSRYIK